jgi:hypothetical protein
MKTTRISIAAAAALLATTLGTTMVFAQSDQPAPPPRPSQGMTGKGDMDHGGMMDMSQMNRMMANCNRMMESMKGSPSHQQNARPDNG